MNYLGPDQYAFSRDFCDSVFFGTMRHSKRLALRKRKLESDPSSATRAKSTATTFTDLPVKRRRKDSRSRSDSTSSSAGRVSHPSNDKPPTRGDAKSHSYSIPKANRLQQSTTLQPVSPGHTKNSKYTPKCVSLNYFCQFIDSILEKRCRTDEGKKSIAVAPSSPKYPEKCTETFFDNMSDMELKMWKNLHFRELQFYPLHDYMDRQAFLNPRMRAILFDWMTEVCQEYQLKRETLHIALINVDRYLSAVKNLKRSKLQLVGVASLLIASKVEEIYAPRGSEFVMTTDGAYSAQEIFEMEMKILKELDWKITPVTTFTWLNLYTRKIHQYSKLRSSLSEEICDTYSGVIGQNYFERKCCEANNAAKKEMGIFVGVEDELVSGVQVGSVAGAAAFPTQPFEMIMEKIDLLMLDINSLQFTPSLITAAMLYHFLPPIMPNLTRDNVLEVTKYEFHQIQDVLKWASLYLRNFSPKGGPNVRESQYRKDILPFDFYTMQQHHPKALRHYTRVWEKLQQTSNSQNIKIHVVVRQYHGRKYDYDASLSASLKQLCKVHSDNVGVDIGGDEMLFFSGPVFSNNSDELDTHSGIVKISDLFLNERGQTEIFAISLNLYKSITKMKCVLFIQDMDTLKDVKASKTVASKSCVAQYTVKQRALSVFGMKKANARHNFEVLKHTLEKYVMGYKKKVEDLVFMLGGFVIDFSNIGSPLHHTKYLSSQDLQGPNSVAKSKAARGKAHNCDSRDNPNIKKTPATARKKARRNPQINRSDLLSSTTKNVEEDGLLKLIANLSGDVIIECYRKKYFGDVHDLRYNTDHRLISDEVLELSDIC